MDANENKINKFNDKIVKVKKGKNIFFECKKNHPFWYIKKTKKYITIQNNGDFII